jgi:hypothetical protein
MHGRLRLLALAAVGLAVATVAALIASRLQLGSVVNGVPAAAPATSQTAEPEPTVTEFPTAPTTSREPSTTYSLPTSSSTFGTSTSTASGPVTVTKRKTVTTAPACPSLVTNAEIGRLTGTTASPEPASAGYCGFDLSSGGSANGVVLVVLTGTTDSGPGAQATTFEGNSAYRTTSAVTTCDLRVALTDDQSAPFRALWVSLALNTATESTCPTVDKLTKMVFDKLPNA